MAYFAELDENDNVVNVIVVDDNDILDSNGVEQETLGIEFCKKLLGENTKWIQTSPNGSFRKNYATIGEIYDQQRDAFRFKSAPYSSWILDEKTCRFKAPVDLPADADTIPYEWDEDNLQWKEVIQQKPFPTWFYNQDKKQWEPPIPYPNDGKKYKWNEQNQTWDAIIPILDGQQPKVI